MFLFKRNTKVNGLYLAVILWLKKWQNVYLLKDCWSRKCLVTSVKFLGLNLFQVSDTGKSFFQSKNYSLKIEWRA